MRLPGHQASGSRMGSGFLHRAGGENHPATPCALRPKGVEFLGTQGNSAVATKNDEEEIDGLQFCQALIELGDGAYPTEVILERDMLVGGVGVFIGQSEPHQDTRHLEGVVHLRDKWNRPSLADEHGFLPETLLQRLQRRFENRMRVRRGPGLSFAEHLELARDRFREQLANVLLDLLGDLVRVLARHQARGEFGVGLCGNDGFRTVSRVSAPDSVELARRARPQPLDNGGAFFPAITGRADGLAKLLLLPGKRIERLALGPGELGDVVVKTGNRDAEILVVQPGKQLTEDGERVGNGSAKNAGVQILRRAGNLHLEIVQAAQAIRKRRDSGRDRKSTRLNSSHGYISYAVFCLKKKKE